MTERRKRKLLLKDYLKEACPYTRNEIMQLIDSGVVKVVWQRGVLGFIPKTPEVGALLNDFVERGKLPPNPVAKRRDFALRPMGRDIPHLEV